MTNYIPEKQLQLQLNISRSTLYRYKTTLGLPFIKIGGKTFYDQEEIKLFFNQHSSHIKLNKND